VGNQNRGAVLAEPLPWTVIQGVILVLVMINNELLNYGLVFIHANHPVRIIQGAIPTRIDIRIGIF
jgi:hypothetical protein